MLLEPHIYLTLIYSYVTLSNPPLYTILPYPTLPHSALPYPTLPHLTLLYLTLLYPTLPSDPTPTSQKTPHNPKDIQGVRSVISFSTVMNHHPNFNWLFYETQDINCAMRLKKSPPQEA